MKFPGFHGLALLLLTLVAVLALAVFGATPSAHADNGAAPTCLGFSACTSHGYGNGGYQNVMNTPYWRQGTGENCTNYVAYRLIQNGASANYGPFPGNANTWGSYFAQRNVTPNSTPAVGAIAWWGANADPSQGIGTDGHVAYVEHVYPDGSIDISEANYANQFAWPGPSPPTTRNGQQALSTFTTMAAALSPRAHLRPASQATLRRAPTALQSNCHGQLPLMQPATRFNALV